MIASAFLHSCRCQLHHNNYLHIDSGNYCDFYIEMWHLPTLILLLK